MIRAVVYFAGPATVWSDSIDPREIIAEASYPSAWLARMWCRSVHGSLDPERCGYALFRDGQQLEHVVATRPAVAAA